MQHTTTATTNIEIKSQELHASKTTVYSVWRDSTIIGTSKPYKQNGSVIKSIRAMKKHFASRKIMTAEGKVKFVVASKNGSIVFASSYFADESILEGIARDIQSFFDNDHEAIVGGRSVKL